MNLQFDSGLAVFREMVREAVRNDLPPDMAARQKAFGGLQSEHPDTIEWTRNLNRRGWTVPHWPLEHGGQNWTPLQHFVFEEELCNAWAPDTNWAATHMVGGGRTRPGLELRQVPARQ
jgi:alkylation response protein AidB-like acyl-CoA dehydrogenase